MGSPVKNEDNNDAQSQDIRPWVTPDAVMGLRKMKLRKKALQARMKGKTLSQPCLNNDVSTILGSINSAKRKNPFAKNDENKKPKSDNNIEPISPDFNASSDSTLFKLFNTPNSSSSTPARHNLSGILTPITSFKSILQQNEAQNIVITKTDGEKWIPIDWTLKDKIRFMAPKPFHWSKQLKTSEEASGITGFVRCLDTRINTSLDTSPKAQFHQCCLYWQHPNLPWLPLFPRKVRTSTTIPSCSSAAIRESLKSNWDDSFRSLFQLVRARQCPYFYVCLNNSTALFRAAGIGGYSGMHVIITPTTRGFRQMLKQEEITFTMPLKNKRQSIDNNSDQGYDTQDGESQLPEDSQDNCADAVKNDDDDAADEEWLLSMGVNNDDIKQINYTQAKKVHRAECEVDNSEQSLVFIEDSETHFFYNFLINCKSLIATTGTLAGIPPTLLAPVAFHGASLQSLKVREDKVCDSNSEFYSIELNGPILPHTVHNLCSLFPKDCNMTAAFRNVSTTDAFSKVNLRITGKSDDNKKEVVNDINGSQIFGRENLSDCGLNKELVQNFCLADSKFIQHVDSLKYNCDTELYTWT